jgi:hypothetical protein
MIMIRNLKRGGALLLATMALQGLIAGAAQAEFQSSSSHTLLTGGRTTHQFSAAPGTGLIGCETEWHATLSAKLTADLTISPAYGFCRDDFGRMVHFASSAQLTVTTDGTLHRTGHTTYTTTGSGGNACVVTVGSQSNKGISYKNLGGTKGLEIITNQTGIETTVTGGFLNCGVVNGEYAEGTYTGTTIVTAKDTAGLAVEFNKLP